jgi:hypothetical protein
MAMVPEREWRMPTLMGSSAAAALRDIERASADRPSFTCFLIVMLCILFGLIGVIAPKCTNTSASAVPE